MNLKPSKKKRQKTIKKTEKLSGVNYTELKEIVFKGLTENNENIINTYKDVIKIAIENSTLKNPKKVASDFEKVFSNSILTNQEKQKKEMKILLEFAFEQAKMKSGIGIKEEIIVSSELLLRLTNKANLTNKKLVQKITDIVPSYYADQILKSLGEEISEGSTEKGRELIKKLKKCKPGIDWRKYEKICKEIISFCFVPPLFEPLEQVWNDSGDERKDLLIRIPPDTTGYWGWIFAKYDQSVIVECKDYSTLLPANAVHITDKYFGPDKSSMFGIILCRSGVNQSANNALKRYWILGREKLICLTDRNMIEMINYKEKGEDPGIVIGKAIWELKESL